MTGDVRSEQMRLVTSFSEKYYERVGHRFVDTFDRYWPERVLLHCFSEDMAAPSGLSSRVVWHDLRQDAAHEEFCRRYAGAEWNHPHDFNMMSVRFCHKVFAVTSSELPMGGWRVWVDADVVTEREVGEDWISRALPGSALLSFLGRRGWMRRDQKMYTECGFVGYQTDHPLVRALLHDMRAIYTTGRLFSLGRYNWHDSYVFDFCRRQLQFREETMHDLAGHLPAQTFHPWPKTVLAEMMTHYKGPKAKMEVYGS